MTLPPPVVKAVPDTVAVKEGATRLLAVTVTVPSWCEKEPVPEGTEPRLTDAGTVMARAAWASDGVVRTTKAAIPATAPTLPMTLMRWLPFPYVVATAIAGPARGPAIGGR